MKVRFKQNINVMELLTICFAFIFNAQFSICFDNSTAGLQLRDFTPTNPPPREMGRCALYHLDHAGSDPDEVEYHDYGQIQADGWTQAGMGLGERGTFRIVVDHFCQEDNRCDPGDFVRYAWTYEQDWKPGLSGVSTFSVWINIHAGVIVKMEIRPPTEPWTDPDQPPSGFIPLHRPSDFIFLCWKQACSGDTGIDNCMKGLQWIIDFSPNDDYTSSVMQWYRRTYAPDGSLGDWPGQQDGPAVNEDDVGHHDLSYWIVGTPSAMSTVWLLLDHQQSLGGMTFDRVNLYTSGFALHIVRNDGIWL